MTAEISTKTMCIIIKHDLEFGPPHFHLITLRPGYDHAFMDLSPPRSFKTRVDAILTARDRGYAIVDQFHQEIR